MYAPPRRLPRALAALLVAAGVFACAGGARADAPPGPSLAIQSRGAWHTWWRAERAPGHWAGADTTVTGALAWHPLAPGIEWASARLAGEGPAWRMRLVVVRIDPARVRIGLDLALDPKTARPAWTIARAPHDAIVALNAGQFVESLPWGAVVIDGHEHLRPGRGPLAVAVVVDAGGAVRWIPADSLGSAPAGARTVFESYPVLLAHDGVVPQPLRLPGFGVDLLHCDARLALGQARDGRLLVVLTRFDGLGESAGALPVGPTTPEMAAVMGALGARDAVLLDGGISAQLLLRDAHGRVAGRWSGWRRVPLALVVRAR